MAVLEGVTVNPVEGLTVIVGDTTIGIVALLVMLISWVLVSPGNIAIEKLDGV